MIVPKEWTPLNSLIAYKRYYTNRNDMVGFEGDPCVHQGNLAYVMSGRVWMHTLCGIAYAVYPDPLSKDLRHDVALHSRETGGMRCLTCEAWEEEEWTIQASKK